MYSETITLFNRYHSRTGDIWYPHILSNVDFNADKASIMARYGENSKDKAVVHLKYETVGGQIVIDGIPYFPPKSWAGQLNDQLASTITLNDDANYFDFFILGEYGSTNPIDDDNYTDGFYEYMRKKSDYCFSLTSVSSPYRLIPHFEILAK